MPRISVLMTLYNREAYIEDAMRSVLASTFEDFELIVVDDCSKDRSCDIAKTVADSDARVRFVQNEQNLGDYGNRKKAASLATGEFLKYVDSDDMLYPHSLQVMVASMQADTALALSHSMPEDDVPYPWQLSSSDAYRKHFLGRGCLSCGPTSAIIRRTVFEEAGGFRPEWGVLSDIDLWLRIAATWPVSLMPPGLAWWRRHEGQEFTKDDAAMVYLQRGYELDMEALNNDACPLSAADRLAAVKRKQQHFARRIWNLGLKGRSPLKALRLFRDSGLPIGRLLSGLRRYA